MKRGRAVLVGALLVTLLALPPSAAWAYTEIRFANNLTVPNNGTVMSSPGKNVGGKVYGLPVGGTVRVAMIQGSGFIGSAQAAAGSYTEFGPTSAVYTNSRIQCLWKHAFGHSGGLSCWRYAS